jgi:hypothetical protein
MHARRTKQSIPKDVLAKALRESPAPRISVISASDVRDGEIWLSADVQSIDSESIANLLCTLSGFGYAADYEVIMPSVGGVIQPGGVPSKPQVNRPKICLSYSSTTIPQSLASNGRYLTGSQIFYLIICTVILQLLVRAAFF